MANKKFTVTWEPGTFGHLLQAIIAIQCYGATYDKIESDSHSQPDWPGTINTVHPYDINLIDDRHRVIKPYFKNANLKFFPKYLNYVKTDQKSTPVELLRLYWNYHDPICPKSFNIDMSNFFTNVSMFKKDIQKFLDTDKLLDDTIYFIDEKRKVNLPHFTDYNEKILHTSSCCKAKTFKDISNLTDYEIGLVLCDYLQGEVHKVNVFANAYNNELITSTMDIIRYEN